MNTSTGSTLLTTSKLSANQKGFSSLIIILGIILVIGIAGGAFYLGKASSQPQEQKPIVIPPALPSPTDNLPTPPPFPPASYSPKPIPQNILSAIQVVPINASLFEKRIVDSDNCNNPVGLVSYSDQKTGNSMQINSTKLTISDPFKSSIQSVVNFVNHSTSVTDYMDIKDWDFAFRDYCGGGLSYLFKEFKNINYPNTDQARAIEVIGGNGGIGFEEIRVYAIKGDNVILLKMILIDEDPLYKNINNACMPPEGFSSKELAFQCIKNTAASHPELDQDALKRINELINQFAIK